jgi:hypothetical protein
MYNGRVTASILLQDVRVGLGEKLYAFGEDKRAVAYFENSINQGTTEFFEDWASHNELFNISHKRQKALSK